MSTAIRDRPIVSVTADVEIDPDDLADMGWHHEDDCPRPVIDPAVTDAARTAHQLLGHRLADVAACSEEPCRSLPLDAVLSTMSRR